MLQIISSRLTENDEQQDQCASTQHQLGFCVLPPHVPSESCRGMPERVGCRGQVVGLRVELIQLITSVQQATDIVAHHVGHSRYLSLHTIGWKNDYLITSIFKHAYFRWITDS